MGIMKHPMIKVDVVETKIVHEQILHMCKKKHYLPCQRLLHSGRDLLVLNVDTLNKAIKNCD